MFDFPEIDPVAFSLGPLDIRWYALAYLAGFLLGWQYVLYLCGLDKEIKTYEARIHKTDIDDFLPWGVLGVILGGRLGYVLFYQPQLIWMAPLEIPAIWNGGMSFHGGVLGLLTAMGAFAWKRRLPFLNLTDMICCAAPIGLFFGRVANFINGELFGRPTEMPWGVVFPRGGYLPRHPSQLYEAALEGLLLALVMAILVHRPGLRHRPGLLSGLFLIGYALCRVTAEFFREPDLHIGFVLGPFTMGQMLSVPMVLGGAFLVACAVNKGRSPIDLNHSADPADKKA